MMDGFCGGLCVCWLLPLALLSGVVLVSKAIGVAWRNRGLERGAVYCAGCRFSLQGCASWNCPECGAHLDEGRVMTPGADRPLPLIPRVLLVVLAAAGPLVLAGVLLALVVPVNYFTNRTLELMPEVEDVANQSQIDLRNYGEVAWWGRGRPGGMSLQVTRRYKYQGAAWNNYEFELPLAGAGDVVLTDRVWGRVVEQCGLDQETQVWRNAARAELVLALRYMAGERGVERPTLVYFRVHEHAYESFEPDPLFVFFESLLGLVMLGLIVRWTVRWHGRVMDVYLHRHARLAERVNGWIGDNREKAGLDGGGGEVGADE